MPMAAVEAIRKQAERPVPLAWRPGIDSGAIEVYPAATLMTRNLPAKGYKAQTAPARKLRNFPPGSANSARTSWRFPASNSVHPPPINRSPTRCWS